MAAAIPGQFKQFSSQGLQFGYSYRNQLIADESTDSTSAHEGILAYRPTTAPGARLPHAVVLHNGGAVSTLDTLAPGALTVLTAQPEDWHSSLPAGPQSLPIFVVGLVAPAPNDQHALLALLGVGCEGAVLVRPDGHVAWRTARGRRRRD